jgi:hypothetical protein
MMETLTFCGDIIEIKTKNVRITERQDYIVDIYEFGQYKGSISCEFGDRMSKIIKALAKVYEEEEVE